MLSVFDVVLPVVVAFCELVEIVELKDHPYFIAGQFHPEFQSRPDRPGPLFVGLIKNAKELKNKK